MKLHLPVRLFRAVVAVMAVASASLTVPQAYAVSNITYEGYKIESDYSAEGAACDFYEDTVLAAEESISFLSNSVNISYDSPITDLVSLSAVGGAVYMSGGTLILNTPGEGTFAKNAIEMDIDIDSIIPNEAYLSINAAGGAILGNVEIIGGSSTVFSENKVDVTIKCAYDYENSNYYTPNAYIYGGAINGEQVIMSGSGDGSDLTFADNYAGYREIEEIYGGSNTVYGGAISVRESWGWDGSEWKTIPGLVSIENFDSVVFSGNIASNNDSWAYGGAIYGNNSRWGNEQNVESIIRISGNNEVIFENNFAGNNVGGSFGAGAGGAIYGDTVILVNNGDVVFCGNVADQGGAAIDASHVIIQNNDSVVFRDNFQSDEHGYCSSSISANTLVLSAAKDKSIEIRESISVSNLEIGNSYSAESGITLSQMGHVIFSGADAEENYKQSQVRSEADVNRTFSVTNATLNGGSFILADEAILTAKTFTTTAGSGAVFAMQGGILNNSAGTYTINSGTSFLLSGRNKATVSTLQLNDDGLLSFSLSDIHARHAALTLSGNFEVNSGAVFCVNFAEGATVYSKNALITLADGSPDDLSWNISDIMLIGPNGILLGGSSLYWEGNTLYVTFNDLPTYQPTVIYADEASDVTSVSDMEDAFIFRVQGDVTVTVEDAPVMNEKSSLSFISDEADSSASISFKSYGKRLFDIGEEEKLIVEGLNRFAMDSTYSYADDEPVAEMSGTLAYIKEGDFILRGNKEVSISNNTVYAEPEDANSYSLIYVDNGTFLIEDNQLVEFEYNHYLSDPDYGLGGYEFIHDSYREGCVVKGTFSLKGNTKVVVTGNILQHGDWLAGGFSQGTLIAEGNKELYFSGNSIYNNWARYSEVEGGYPCMFGGVHSGDSSFRNNEKITFYSNHITNKAVSDKGITSQNGGGALFGMGGGPHNFDNNGDILFESNFVSVNIDSSSAHEGSHLYVNGGALTGIQSMSNNDSITFTSNSLMASLYTESDYEYSFCQVYGGALSNHFDAKIKGNGSVKFDGNSASLSIYGNSLPDYVGYVVGGALNVADYSDFHIVDNNEVLFNKNHVEGSGSGINVYGGAIYVSGKGLAIQNNESVLFSRNYEKTDSGYRLRGLVINNNNTSNIRLSAAQGKSIVIQDSIGSGAIYRSDSFSNNIVVNFNPYYEREDGEKIAQTGDIVLTGLYTEGHLKEIKNGTAGTAEEILNSRTSEIWGQTNVYDGRLRIEDGAIYKGCGLTVHSSVSGQSNPTVLLKNGEMNHDGYSITLNAGARLELSGTNTISADNLQLNNGAGFVFNVDDTHLTTAALSYTGALTLGGELVICINSEDGLTIGNTYKLMTVTDATATDAMSWDGTHITIQTGNGLGVVSNDLIWQDNVLYLNYTGTPTINELKLTWLGGKKAVWQNGHETLWENALGEQVVYRDGDHVTFTKDTIEIVGEVQPGSITLAPEKSLTFKTKYDKKAGEWSGSIGGEGISVTIAGGAKGKVTMNDGNTYTGITSIESGTVNVGGATSFGKSSIAISGGTLDLKSKEVANDIELTGSATIKGGKKYLGTYTQTGGELMKGSVLNVAESATISGGVVNGTLSGLGTVTIDGEVELGVSGKLTTAGLSLAEDARLTVSSKGMVMNSKTSVIDIQGGTLTSEGKISAASLQMNGGDIEVVAAKAQSLSLNDKLATNSLYGANIQLGGKMSVAGNLVIDGVSQLHLFDPSGKNKAQSLAVKGGLNFGGGSNLRLNGALSAKDLTLGSGTLTLCGAKLSTIKVSNSLTLNGGTTLNLGFNVTEKDVAKGKAYNIFTFKTIDPSITDAALNELLGLGTDAATLAFDSKRKAITLTVTDAAAWNAYAEYVRTGELVVAASEDDELVESAGTQVLVAPAAVDMLMGKVADTLVQSTWGTAGASRSFGDTIAARGTHATALADGKGSAWISTMGGSSRLSSDGGHAGADYTLTGAAFGMEARLSEKSTVGLAIGNSWGKVSTFSAYPVDQDSTHQGIYGKHLLGSSTTLSWMAAHTRTESDANLAGMACDWTQDALQLDARVDKLFAISDRTTVSAFVGLQYLATDKGECNGLSTGSLQNLRGEIGVSAAHKATDKAYVYGELSFIGDMVRHNPTATVGDYRSRGANPGRAGLNLSVGGSYQLNEDWSLNASYNLELMQNQTSHSANVGATYSF